MPMSEPRGHGRSPGGDSADDQQLSFNAVATAAGCQHLSHGLQESVQPQPDVHKYARATYCHNNVVVRSGLDLPFVLTDERDGLLSKQISSFDLS